MTTTRPVASLTPDPDDRRPSLLVDITELQTMCLPPLPEPAPAGVADEADWPDLRDMTTVTLVAPHIQASIPFQLLTFAERHETQARRLRAAADEDADAIAQMCVVRDAYLARQMYLRGLAQRDARERAQLDYLDGAIIQLRLEISKVGQAHARHVQDANEHVEAARRIRRTLTSEER